MPYSLVYVLLEVRAGHGTEQQLHLRSLGESQYEVLFACPLYDAREVPAPIQRFADPDLRLMTDKTPKMLRPRQRTLDARRRDLDGAVVAFGLDRRSNDGGDPRAELVVYRTVLPIQEHGEQRPPREPGLHQLGSLGKHALDYLLQPLQSRRLSHLLRTIKKQRARRPLAHLQHVRLYLRVCRLQGSQGRQRIVWYTDSCRANRFYEAFHSRVLITQSLSSWGRKKAGVP